MHHADLLLLLFKKKSISKAIINSCDSSYQTIFTEYTLGLHFEHFGRVKLEKHFIVVHYVLWFIFFKQNFTMEDPMQDYSYH